MQHRLIKLTSLLAVLLLVVMALLFMVPVKAKSALGDSGFNSASALANDASKALTLLDKTVSCRSLALGICDGPENNVGTSKQTGAGGYIDSADKAYDAIRSSTTDVKAIATNTGIKPENIQKVKDHLFNDTHVLDRYVDYGIPAEVKRFDSDIKIAEAWKRLEAGKHTKEDIQLLKHETAERWIEKKRGAGYTESHDRASESFPAPNWWED